MLHGSGAHKNSNLVEVLKHLQSKKTWTSRHEVKKSIVLPVMVRAAKIYFLEQLDREGKESLGVQWNPGDPMPWGDDKSNLNPESPIETGGLRAFPVLVTGIHRRTVPKWMEYGSPGLVYTWKRAVDLAESWEAPNAGQISTITQQIENVYHFEMRN